MKNFVVFALLAISMAAVAQKTSDFPRIVSIKFGTPPNQLVHEWMSSPAFYAGWEKVSPERWANNGIAYRVDLVNEKGERFIATMTVSNISEHERQLFDLKDPDTVEVNITPPYDATGDFTVTAVYFGKQQVAVKESLASYKFSIF